MKCQMQRNPCHLFILLGEARPVDLVDRHHHSHHVFPVHDGDGQDVFGGVLGQLIHKVAKMRALKGKKGENKCLTGSPVLAAISTLVRSRRAALRASPAPTDSAALHSLLPRTVINYALLGA